MSRAHGYMLGVWRGSDVLATQVYASSLAGAYDVLDRLEQDPDVVRVIAYPMRRPGEPGWRGRRVWVRGEAGDLVHEVFT